MVWLQRKDPKDTPTPSKKWSATEHPPLTLNISSFEMSSRLICLSEVNQEMCVLSVPGVQIESLPHFSKILFLIKSLPETVSSFYYTNEFSFLSP